MEESREIKFRYVYGEPDKPETYFFRYFTIEEIESGAVFEVYVPIFKEIISRDRFTGSKDKNGKEIYENDKWKRGQFIGIVEFEYCGWQFNRDPECDIYSYPYFYQNSDIGEIIGNTHGVKQ